VFVSISHRSFYVPALKKTIGFFDLSNHGGYFYVAVNGDIITLLTHKDASKLTVSQNCSIFNNLKGLDYKKLSPFYVLE
jgi:hypothetical protein